MASSTNLKYWRQLLISRKRSLIPRLSTSTYRKQLGEGSSSFLTHLVSREMNRKRSIISFNALDSNMHVGDRTKAMRPCCLCISAYLILKVSSIDCLGTNRKLHSQISAIEDLALYKSRELEYSPPLSPPHHHHVFTLEKDSKTAQIYK